MVPARRKPMRRLQDFAPTTSTDANVDTQTIAQRGGGLGGPSSGRAPAPDVQTIDARGGGIGGSGPSKTKGPDTQTIDQRGGGLGGPRKDGPKTTTSRGGAAGLTFKGKQALPVIDKRTVKQKLRDAQARKG